MYILFAGVFYCFQQFYDHTSSPILSTNSLRQTQTYSPETWQLSQRRQRQMYNEFNNMSLTFDSVIFHFHFFFIFSGASRMMFYFSFYYVEGLGKGIGLLMRGGSSHLSVSLGIRGQRRINFEGYCILRHYKFLKYFMQKLSSSPTPHPTLLLEE